MFQKNFVFILLLLPTFLFSQIRNGWRSVYDKDGRLSNMKYYVEGTDTPDSTTYFQYYTDNVVKAIIKGELVPGKGCQDGEIWLFSEIGEIMSYTARSHGQSVFTMKRETDGKISTVWTDQFTSRSDFWKGEKNMSVSDNHLLLSCEEEQASAIFQPEIPLDFSSEFKFLVRIPVCQQTVEQLGVLLGWKDSLNWVLVEIIKGTQLAIYRNVEGKLQVLSDIQPIERPNVSANLLGINSDGKNLIIECNNIMEKVIPLPDLTGGKLGFMTRSKGMAFFDEMMFGYSLSEKTPVYAQTWIGLGTGLLFSGEGLILTTYDVIANAAKLRVKGCRNGKIYTVNAELVDLDEVHNIAVLKIPAGVWSEKYISPFGLIDRRPVSDSKIYSAGFPHAVSSIYMPPSVFEGRVLPVGSGGYSGMVELPFRYGMVGSPVFDDNLHLIGIVCHHGFELNYSEIIEVQDNKKTIPVFFRNFNQMVDSPFKDLPFNEKQKIVSESVVLIETGLF